MIYHRRRAQQQVSCLCFDQVAGDKKGIPPSRIGEDSRCAHVRGVFFVFVFCVYAKKPACVQFSSPPQGHAESSCSFFFSSAAFGDICTAAPRVRREGGMRRPFPLNVSTGCRSHTAAPGRLIMNNWLINGDY